MLANAAPFQLESDSAIMRGKIIHIWTVHHECRRAYSEFKQPIPSSISEADKFYIELLSFVSYTLTHHFADVSARETSAQGSAEVRRSYNSAPSAAHTSVSANNSVASRQRSTASHGQRCRTDDV